MVKEKLLIDVCNKFGFTYVERKIINQNSYVGFICSKHSEVGVQYKKYDHLKHSKYGCPYCFGLHQTADDLRNNSRLNPNVKVIGDYKAHNIKIECECRKCGHEWSATPNHLKSGKGCPNCAIVNRTNILTKSHDEFLKNVTANNPNIEILGKYTFSKNRIKCKCRIHKNEWHGIAYYIGKGKTGCPICNSSMGENKLCEILDKYSINYYRQYSFKDCVHKNRLYFDVYLPEQNVCIEFQGEQHYFPVDFSSKGEKWAIKEFKNNQIRDDIKRNYCLNNNISLIEVPYWERNNMENFILNKFNNININIINTQKP